MESALIYNLFPRLTGTLDQWPRHLDRAREMGFNWIFINPFHYPGFSGSLYAVKHYERLNPDFLPPDAPSDGLEMLETVVQEARDRGLKLIMDLVINHTAVDSPLTESHPGWYAHDGEGKIAHPSAIDPSDVSKVTVWGDLAKIDNEGAEDRNELWAYWRHLVDRFARLGFNGFRCDAAYQVPMALWRHLIAHTKEQHPEVIFLAETLGCLTDEVLQFKGVGFDYLFNSSKWWNFDAPWCLEQHEAYRHIAPSISFPESHDTARLAHEMGSREQLQRQRYAFAAAFSQGVMIPIGYEYGFVRRLNVVRTTPEHWEIPGCDLVPFIGQVNRIKGQYPALAEEGSFRLHRTLDRPALILEKRGNEGDSVLLVLNKDWHQPQKVQLPDLNEILGTARAKVLRICRDGFEPEFANTELDLEKAEVVYIVAD